MLNITRRDIEEAHNYARDSLRASRDYSGGGGSSIASTLVQTVEVGAGAAAVGVLTGRFGPLHIGANPIPLDLAGGVGLHLATFIMESFFGIKAPAKHLHNVADGALAGYFTKFGVGVGTQMRAKAGKPALNISAISGEDRVPAQLLPSQRETARNKGPLTEAELIAMAQAVR